MPELPEVETVMRGLAPHLKGVRIKKVTLKRNDLRFPLPAPFAGRLKGAVIKKIGRRAKYLLFHLSNGLTLIAHLGMTGRFRIEHDKKAHRPGSFYDTAPERKEHDQLVLQLENGKRLTYNDARRFGFLQLLDKSELAKRFVAIGVEPLSGEFNEPALYDLFEDRKSPVKVALLDQALVAGIGNIYACEALWDAKISPKKQAGKLTRAETASLSKAIKKVLKKAIALGGATLRDFHGAGGTAGRFQHEFCVYDRTNKPCFRCKTSIKRITQAGRSTFYCPLCQR